MPEQGLLPLLALLLVFAVGVVLIVVLMLSFANALTKHLVSDQFAFAEYIVEHRRPPPEWIRSRTAVERLLHRKPPAEAQIRIPTNDRQRQRMEIRIVRRLTQLIRYFETSAFFDSEDTRTQLLNELTQVREFWKQHELHDIIQIRSGSTNEA